MNLDLVGPFRGPCGLCGHSDARHRVYDAVVEHLAAGESEEQVASDFDLAIVDVYLIGEEARGD